MVILLGVPLPCLHLLTSSLFFPTSKHGLCETLKDEETRRLAYESEQQEYEMNILRSRHTALEERCQTLKESLEAARADADGFKQALEGTLSREKEMIAEVRKEAMEKMAEEKRELHELRERQSSVSKVEDELSLALEKSAKRVAQKAAECKMLRLKLGRLGVACESESGACYSKGLLQHTVCKRADNVCYSVQPCGKLATKSRDLNS